jgi:DHA2 family multidrug resistance protein-like MFS transporter
VIPFVYGIKHLAADGIDLLGPAAMLVGLAVGALFVMRQRTATNPMIDLDLFANRVFSNSIGANTVAMFALVGNAIFTTQYLQSVLGMSPLRAALWSLAPTVLVMAGAPTAAVLARRVGRPAVTSGGFAIAAAGFVVLTRVRPDSSLWVVLIGASLLAMGLVAVMTLVTDAVLTAVSPERAGAASALMETSSELGGAFGMAVLGSIGAAVYRADVMGRLPAGLGSDGVSTIRDTLGGALAVARQLPSGVGHDVVDAARVAFTHGMNMVALVGAVVLVGAAVASYVLRDRKL